MAMIFMDGFDYYSTGQFGRKWDGGAINLVTGVYGNGKAITNPITPVKNLPSNYATGFQGFHLFVPSGFAAVTVVRFTDAGTTQVDLRIDGTGALFFTRNGTTIGSASSNRLSGNTWYWIEVKTTIDPAAGIAEVHVNGTSWLALSGQNTRATANSYFNQVQITFGSTSYQIDSFHVWDTTGSINNGYIGEHAISTLLANGAGTNTSWTRGGTNTGNNYSQVNEANADDDTTYNFSNTPGQIDSYAFADLGPTTGTIAAVAINTVDRVDDATPHVIHHYTLSGGTAGESGDITPSAGYANHQSIRETDPHTSAAWTIAAVNAAEFGVKLIS